MRLFGGTCLTGRQAGFSLSGFRLVGGKIRQAKACPTGNQIHSAARERMAACEAAQREPRPAARSVEAQRFGGVMRAGRIKLAGAGHQRGKKGLVHAHGKQQDARRKAQVFGPLLWMPRNRRSRSASSGANAARATVARG